MPPFVFCETWDKWELEIQEMHWAVEIWRMLGRGDATGLLRHIEWITRKSPEPSMWVFSSHPQFRGAAQKTLFSQLSPAERISEE